MLIKDFVLTKIFIIIISICLIQLSSNNFYAVEPDEVLENKKELIIMKLDKKKENAEMTARLNKLEDKMDQILTLLSKGKKVGDDNTFGFP